MPGDQHKATPAASRTCKGCGRELPLTADFWNRDRKVFKHFCKKCDCARARQWALNNAEKDRARKRKWYEEHREITIARAAKRNTANRDKHREISRKYVAKNREKCCRSLQAWRERNREKARELTNDWHSKHAAQLRAKRKAWRREHPDEAHKRDQKSYQKRHAENPGAVRDWYRKRYLRCREDYLAAARNRRASKVPAPGTHTAEDIVRLYEAQAGECAACHVPLARSGKEKYSIDHIVPLKPRSGGARGTNDASNLQLLCGPCNRAKSNVSPGEWATRMAERNKPPQSSKISEVPNSNFGSNM